MNVAQNVVTGANEGINMSLPLGLDAARPFPGQPSMLDRLAARVGEPERPMPLTQTAAMLGGMIALPGPDIPKGAGLVDNTPRGARRGSPRPDGPMQPTQMESLVENVPDIEVPDWTRRAGELGAPPQWLVDVMRKQPPQKLNPLEETLTDWADPHDAIHEFYWALQNPTNFARYAIPRAAKTWAFKELNDDPRSER